MGIIGKKSDSEQGAAKTYVGPTNHKIGNEIQFSSGFYTTSDQGQQELIESDMLFGTKITTADEVK